MLSDLERADEGFDGEGRSGVFHRLSSQSDRLRLPLADLEIYDGNVRRHLEAINRRRPKPVTLRYFQHLAALYAEVYLDRWSSDGDALAGELNAFAARLEEPVVFAADDLNKLAFWMATGSGKTLIMHLNCTSSLRTTLATGLAPCSNPGTGWSAGSPRLTLLPLPPASGRSRAS